MSQAKNKRLIGASIGSFVAINAWAGVPAMAAGEGEGGEGHAVMSSDAKAQLSLATGLGLLEAEIEAGWHQVVAGQRAEAKEHFKAAKALLESDRGAEWAKAGLDAGHIAQEMGELIAALDTELTVEDLKGIYEHGLFEVDEHAMIVGPLAMRDPGLSAKVAVALLHEAGKAYQKAQRDEDGTALHRAQSLVAQARNQMGRTAAELMAKDADRFKAAIALIDGLPGKIAGGGKASAILSDISRVELMTSGLTD